jgi:MYXO-CTERM domain-containing protein
MLDLLTIFKQGSTYDEALTEVYGFDIDGLDARWRTTLTSYMVIASEDGQSGTPMVGALAVLAAAVILWFRRRSSGKSTM